VTKVLIHTQPNISSLSFPMGCSHGIFALIKALKTKPIINRRVFYNTDQGKKSLATAHPHLK